MVIFIYLKTQAPKLIVDEDENALNLQTPKKRQKIMKFMKF